jgi:hypothetical protein
LGLIDQFPPNRPEAIAAIPFPPKTTLATMPAIMHM